MPRKLANLTLSEDEFALWGRRIKDGEERNERLRDATARYRLAFHGQFPTPYPEEGEDEQVTVNRVHRVSTQWIGAMYAQDPKITLKPPWRQASVRSEIAKQEAAINAEMRRVGLTSTLRRAIQTAILDGYAFVKSGFHAEFEQAAEEIAELTTDAEAENTGFDLGPEFFPKGVLLTENHEDHQEKHGRHRRKVQGQLQQLLPIVQKSRSEGLPIDPSIIEELIRLTAQDSAIGQHMALHDEMARKRDREGANQTNLRILAESCWTEYIHNTNVVWDGNATGPHDWRWVAERIIAPAEELREEFGVGEDVIRANFEGPRPGSRSEDLRDGGGAGVKSAMLSSSGTGEEDPDALAEIWKVWDVKRRRIIWYHEGYEKAVRIDPWPHKYLRTPPIRMLFFELKEDSFEPIAPVSFFWSQQLELNRYRTKAGLIARRLSRQAIADPRLSDENISKIAQGEDGTVIKLGGQLMGGQSIRDLFQTIEWGEVPQDFYNLPMVADDDIQRDTGLGETIASGIKAKTATAAQFQQGASGVTLDMKLSAIESFVGQIAADLRGLMRQYYTQARFGEVFWEGVREEFEWTGGDLADFEIEVAFGSSKKQEIDIERMQWMEALKIFTAFQFVDHRKLVSEILKRLGVKDAEEFFLDQATQMPVPMQPGVGPGQGQNQQALPGKVNGPPGAAMQQPMMDLTKVGGA